MFEHLLIPTNYEHKSQCYVKHQGFLQWCRLNNSFGLLTSSGELIIQPL
jgi:hypothetical protein